MRGFLAGLVLLVTIAACGRSESSDASAARVPPLPAPGEHAVATGMDALAYEYELGAADPCELLRASSPAALLGVELGAPFRVYGLCRLEAAVWLAGEPERAVGLEMRREPHRPVPTRFEEFWEREGGGIDLQGGTPEEVQTLAEIGDYALWYPSDRGLQLYAYWGGHNVLVLTIAGAPVEKSLPWAKELARRAIAEASQE
jgi:hypothetical protein